MIKLVEGQFVRLTGMEVKGENDIYIVEHDYTKPDPRYSVVRNEYCLRKVKLNGEKKSSGYTIVFYDEYKEKKNPNMDNLRRSVYALLGNPSYIPDRHINHMTLSITKDKQQIEHLKRALNNLPPFPLTIISLGLYKIWPGKLQAIYGLV